MVKSGRKKLKTSSPQPPEGGAKKEILKRKAIH